MYLILELCPNGELNRFLKTKRHTLIESEGKILLSNIEYDLNVYIVGCQILTKIIEGLIYLHSHNIIHRDLSLANILLTSHMKAVCVIMTIYNLLL